MKKCSNLPTKKREEPFFMDEKNLCVVSVAVLDLFGARNPTAYPLWKASVYSSILIVFLSYKGLNSLIFQTKRRHVNLLEKTLAS